jgi:hypothetical protein
MAGICESVERIGPKLHPKKEMVKDKGGGELRASGSRIITPKDLK